jgi:DNA-directed RNA polymerase specialized sigma24 family protein
VHIHRTAERYLFDEDEILSVYADTLARIYHCKLRGIQNGTRLAAWVITVTRHVVVDTLRKRLGRRRRIPGIDALSTLDRHIVRLYYIEGHSFGVICQMLSRPRQPYTADDLLSALERIGRRISQPILERLAVESSLQSSDFCSVHVLQYGQHLKTTLQRQSEELSPESQLIAAETCAAAQRVPALLLCLTTQERSVLALRFESRLSARQISTVLGLTGPRQAYTMIDRGLRHLRRLLKAKDTLPS